MNDSITATMSGSVIHSTFSIERDLSAASGPRVLRACRPGDEAPLAGEGEGWEVFDFTVDFRVGGAETSHFSFQGGPEVSYDATFQDIVTDRRIVFVYRMAVAGKPISVSLATVELAPSGSGTRLIPINRRPSCRNEKTRAEARVRNELDSTLSCRANCTAGAERHSA